jgi:hypothetical protein
VIAPSLDFKSNFEDGTRVTLADPPITQERAEALLMLQLRKIYLP